MATKDWYAEEGIIFSGNRRIAWNNKKDFTSRVVIFNPMKGYYGEDWTVRLIDKNNNHKDKEFKTQVQAFKYAKQYMRTH